MMIGENLSPNLRPKSRNFILVLMCAFCLSACGNKSRELEYYFSDPDVIEMTRAADQGNLEKADTILKSGVGVNHRGKYGVTPLFWMALTRESINESGFKFLLDSGADCNVMNDSGTSLLYITIQRTRTTALRLCLEHGANPNLYHPKEHPFFRYPIFYAIGVSDIKHVALLVEFGADIEIKGSTGDTPIIFAAKTNKWNIVIMLLNKGAKYDVKNDRGATIVNYLERNRIDRSSEGYEHREKVINFLRERGVEVDPWEKNDG